MGHFNFAVLDFSGCEFDNQFPFDQTPGEFVVAMHHGKIIRLQAWDVYRCIREISRRDKSPPSTGLSLLISYRKLRWYKYCHQQNGKRLAGPDESERS